MGIAEHRTNDEWLIVAAGMAGYIESDADFEQLRKVHDELRLRASYSGDPDPIGTAKLEGQRELLEERTKDRRYRTIYWRPDKNHVHMAELIDNMNTGQADCWGRCLRRRMPGPLWKMASAPSWAVSTTQP